MQLKITWKYCLGFIALNFIIGELHEQAHIQAGYFTCGCYGPRDFNFWSTCDQCAHPSLAILATLAGPLFSCTLMWLGAIFFCKSNNNLNQSFGFSLVFANLPFARIFTALTGGGDEKVVIRFLLGENSPVITSKTVAAVLVLLICVPPVILVFKKLKNSNRFWIVFGFLTIPLIYGMLYHHMFLNSLLQKGIGANTFILGTPDIILVHFVLMLLVFVLMRKYLNLRINSVVTI